MARTWALWAVVGAGVLVAVVYGALNWASFIYGIVLWWRQ